MSFQILRIANELDIYSFSQLSLIFNYLSIYVKINLSYLLSS